MCMEKFNQLFSFMIMGNGYMPRILPVLEEIQNFAHDRVPISSIYPFCIC